MWKVLCECVPSVEFRKPLEFFLMRSYLAVDFSCLEVTNEFSE